MSSLIQRMKKIAGAVNTIKPRQYAKSVLAQNFYLDGNLFIERFDLLNSHSDSMQNRQFRAKAMVDLAMSLECSLKSIIVSLSKSVEKPKIVKNKILKLSHYYEKLFNEVKIRSKFRFKLTKMDESILNTLSKFGVGSRYSQEIWNIQTSTPLSINDDLLSRTIDDPTWMHNLRNLAVVWNNEASKVHKQYLHPHSVLSGKDIKRMQIELETIRES